ncbi:MAG: hypothetical protein HOL85_07980 [Rhodospirillaceae bacterium]|nr:hypothetical protein [Rhodospirillaceae bacterium]MBT6136468.1 hypothetical protein [Rhodospirillaceae bacterium]
MPDVNHETTGYLYLAIEEVAREMQSRLLIARAALEIGLSPIIGPQAWFGQNLDRLPPGFLLLKGNNRVQERMMRLAKRLGHATGSIEEEAFSVCEPREILRLFATGVDEVCDLFFAQGPHHAECLKGAFPSAAEQIKITGNPRADLLADPDLRAITFSETSAHERTNPYLLINTNFGLINPNIGDTLQCYGNCVSVGLLDPNDPSDIADIEEWFAWERRNFSSIITFIEAHRTQPDPLPIVLRPHPSERLVLWDALYANDPLVRVIREGSHLDWTAQAQVMVHTSCTTGLEAHLLGTPTLSLVTPGSRWDGFFIANQVNFTAADPWDAAVKAGELAKQPKLDRPTPKGTELGSHLTLDATQPSAEKIAALVAIALVDQKLMTDVAVYAGQTRRVGLNTRGQAKLADDTNEISGFLSRLESARQYSHPATLREISPLVRALEFGDRS